VPLIEQIVGAATHLHRLLAEYRTALDRALVAHGDGPGAGTPDEDFPF